MEKYEIVKNISQLRIGDTVMEEGNKFPMTVVGIFSDSHEYIKNPLDNTGTIYCDWDGNEGDVWEYWLRRDKIIKIIQE